VEVPVSQTIIIDDKSQPHHVILRLRRVKNREEIELDALNPGYVQNQADKIVGEPFGILKLQTRITSEPDKLKDFISANAKNDAAWHNGSLAFKKRL
jgi:hypothetical protein